MFAVFWDASSALRVLHISLGLYMAIIVIIIIIIIVVVVVVVVLVSLTS